MTWREIHDRQDTGALLTAMRSAYAKNQNVMAAARAISGTLGNSAQAIEIAYDLQAGTYVDAARAAPAHVARWTDQVVDCLRPLVGLGPTSILEVGVGEATTLAGVVAGLGSSVSWAIGLDISWSRIHVARAWLDEHKISATTCVADSFRIPLADNAVDVVYSSHSLEPNGGREADAIRECLRVARRGLVLVEPAYEFASEAAQARMREHGYVRGLREAAQSIGAHVTRHELLPYSVNPLNPSGILAIAKEMDTADSLAGPTWQCPLTGARLHEAGDIYVSEDMGVVYPVVRGIPLLTITHAIVASHLAP